MYIDVFEVTNVCSYESSDVSLLWDKALGGGGVKLFFCHGCMLLVETITDGVLLEGANLLSVSSVTQGMTAAEHMH